MQSVSTFLETQGLSLSNILFDSSGQLAQKVGSMALPTTLFYSADGRLLRSHLGELSDASLAQAMQGFTQEHSKSAQQVDPARNEQKCLTANC